MSRSEETIDPGEAGCRLYLIGPPRVDPEAFAPELEAALAAGDAAAFLMRTGGDRSEARRAAEVLRPLCRARGVAFFVEDDVDLALEAAADGLHLGSAGDVEAARFQLGNERILGVTCGLERHAAMTAGEAGADYVAFGDEAREVDEALLETVAWWSELFVLPCLALARIMPAGCAPLVEAGADFIGAGDAIWRHPKGSAAALAEVGDAIGKARGASPM